MAFGRGHASFTIETLKLAKDSLPAAVTEPPPVFPELLHTPHPLIERPVNDYDYKLKVKSNLNASLRTLHDPSNEQQFQLNRWKEEWTLLPRELRQASRIKKRSAVIQPKVINRKKKIANVQIDLNTFEEKQVDADEGEDEDEDEQKKPEEDIDIDEEEKSKDPEKKKLTDNENEVDGEVPLDEDEDMDEDEAADYIGSYFDPGDAEGDDLDDDGGDGGD